VVDLWNICNKEIIDIACSKDKFGCPLCQNDLDKRQKGFSSGQKTNNPLIMLIPEGIYEQIIVYIFMSFCIAGSWGRKTRTVSGKSPFLCRTPPAGFLSKPTAVGLDHLDGSRVVTGRGEWKGGTSGDFWNTAAVSSCCFESRLFYRFCFLINFIYFDQWSFKSPHRGWYVSNCTPLLSQTSIHSLIYSDTQIGCKCNDIVLKVRNNKNIFNWRCSSISVL